MAQLVGAPPFAYACGVAKRRNARCNRCGGHRDDVGRISSRGRCVSCAENAIRSGCRSIAYREGEAWQRRAEGLRRYVAQLDA